MGLLNLRQEAHFLRQKSSRDDISYAEEPFKPIRGVGVQVHIDVSEGEHEHVEQHGYKQ